MTRTRIATPLSVSRVRRRAFGPPPTVWAKLPSAREDTGFGLRRAPRSSR